MKYFFVAAAILLSQNVHAWNVKTGSMSEWLPQVSVNEKAQSQLGLYFGQRNRAELEVYGNNLLKIYKQQLLKGLKDSGVETDSACATNTKVDFAKDLSRSSRNDEQEFESEILQLDSLDCFASGNLEKATSVFFSDSFQLKAFTDMQASKSDENSNRVCQKTSVLLLGNSDYCTQLSMWRDDSTVIVISINEYNAENVKAPVYLRLVSTVFHKTSDGRIKLYSLTYGRGPNLPFHSVVKSVVTKQHQAFVQQFSKAIAP